MNEEMEKFSFPVKDDYEMAGEENEQSNENEGVEELASEPTLDTEENVENNEESDQVDSSQEEGVEQEATSESSETDESSDDDGDLTENNVEVNHEEEVDYSSYYRDEMLEATGGRFDNADDFVEAYNGLLETVSGKSHIEKLDEATADEFGEGVTFMDVVSYKALDFDKMSDMDVLREKLEKDFPDITEDQMNAQMRPYVLLSKSEAEIEQLIEEDRTSRDEIEDLKARLTREAMGARTDLKEFQDSLNIDNLQISSPKFVEEAPAPQETQAEIDARLERYNSAINNMPDVTVNVGDTNSPNNFVIKKTDEDRNGVSDFLKGDELNGVQRNFIDRHWANEDGSVNIEKLSSDMYKVINYERDLKLAYSQGKSATSKEVKDINNMNFDKQQSGGSSPEGLDQAAEIARRIN